MVTKQGSQPWSWFYEKVLPPLIVAMCLGIAGGLWATYSVVQNMTSQVAQHERDINQLKNDVAIVRAGYMTRIEVLETIKRLELYIELAVMRGKTKGNINTEGNP